jgi:hypothetical protein
VAVRSLREDGLSILVDGLRHIDQKHRQAAIEAFDGYGMAVNDEAVIAMIDILRKGDDRMRKLACGALGRMASVSEFDFTEMRHPLRRRFQGEYGPIMQRVVSAIATALKDEDNLCALKRRSAWE